MQTTNDPAEEVRSALAQLTARARQLAAGGDTAATNATMATTTTAAAPPAVVAPLLHVKRNSHSLYAASRRLHDTVGLPPAAAAAAPAATMPATTRASQQASQTAYAHAATLPPAAADATAFASGPSVELFMARQLGFDAQEQQRLLQQLQRRQTLVAADVAQSTTAATNSSSGGAAAAAVQRAVDMTSAAATGATAGGACAAGEDDVAVMVARAKAAMLQRGRAMVHAQLEHQLRARGEALCRLAWEPYVASLQGDLVTAHVRSCCADGVAGAAASATATQASLSHVQQQQLVHSMLDGSQGVPLSSAAGVSSFVYDGSVAAAALRARAVAFARIVDDCAPSQWAGQCAAYVHEQHEMLLLQQEQQRQQQNDGQAHVTGSTPSVQRDSGAVTVLWRGVASLLSSVTRAAGTSASALTFAHAARVHLESRALRALQSRMRRLRGAVGAYDTASRWSAAQVLDALACVDDDDDGDKGEGAHDTRARTRAGRRAEGSVGGGGGSAWQRVFAAMRVGRYDAAALAAQSVGIAAVVHALERAAAAVSPLARCALPPALELQALYKSNGSSGSSDNGNNSKDAYDVYRQAVLFVLLAGDTGEANDSTDHNGDAASSRTLLHLCGRVAQSLEQALWLRLACVRRIDDAHTRSNTSGNVCVRVQSLTHVQQVILDDMASIVALARGDVLQLAHFLLHAVLPSTALRLLLENDATHIDGLHMALCLTQCNALHMTTAGATTAAPGDAAAMCNKSAASSNAHASTLLDAPLDLSRYVSRYCMQVLLPLSQGAPTMRVPLRAVYAYFAKTNHVHALVELCMQHDTLCTRLLGARGQQLHVAAQEANGDDASASAHDEMTNTALMCMRAVAKHAAARGRALLAAQANIAIVAHTRDTPRAPRDVPAALRRAVCVLVPALAHAMHNAPTSRVVADTFALAADVYELVVQQGVSMQRTAVHAADAAQRDAYNTTSDNMNNTNDIDDDDDDDDDAQTTQQLRSIFEALCALARVYTAAARGNQREVLQLFFALPFVPQKAEQTRHVTPFSSLPKDIVVALRALVPHVLHAAASRLQELAQYTRTYMHDDNTTVEANARDVSNDMLDVQVNTSALCSWLIEDNQAQYNTANATMMEGIHAFMNQYMHDVM